MPIVCPFCPLHCDDLRVDADGRVNVDCPIAATNFSAALAPPTPPRIGDRTVNDQEIGELVAELIARPGGRRIRTTGAPLAVARQLCRLHDAGRAEVMIDQTPTQAALQTAIGRDGTISATLADVKRHADLLWILGDVSHQTPRLLDRLTAGNEQPSRNIVHWPAPVAADAIAHLAAALRQRSDAKSESDWSSPCDAATAVAPLRSAIAAARYVAIVVAADAFDAGAATSAAELLLTTTRWLNEPRGGDTRRAVLVSLDAAQTLRAVAAWTSNQTLPSADASAAIRLGDAAAAIRLGGAAGDPSLNPEIPNPAPAVVRLQIGGRDPGPAGAQAFVPISIAGVHHSDAVIRGDAAVTLGLQPFASSPLPRSQKWLQPLW